MAAGTKINVTDNQGKLLNSLPFELAFPVHSTLDSNVEAVAFDRNSGRVS